jgi:hypothetical protein
VIDFPGYLASFDIGNFLPVSIVSTINCLCNTNQVPGYRMLGYCLRLTCILVPSLIGWVLYLYAHAWKNLDVCNFN